MRRPPRRAITTPARQLLDTSKGSSKMAAKILPPAVAAVMEEERAEKRSAGAKTKPRR